MLTKVTTLSPRTNQTTVFKLTRMITQALIAAGSRSYGWIPSDKALRLSASYLVLVASFIPAAALPQIYKCTEADGSVIYAQTPCSTELVTDTEASSSETEAQDCHYANTFAAWTARLMRAGTTSNEMFG